MAGERRQAGSGRPDDVPDEIWAEAVRRAGVIAELAKEKRCTRAKVQEAGRVLGLSVQQTYRSLALYRKNPVTASLVPGKPGPGKGTRRFAPRMEEIIERATQAIYARPERPTLDRLRREVRQDCQAAGLKAPSRKALAARVSARVPREMVRAREGADVARQRFAPVREGPRPAAPLRFVQADHTRVDLVVVDDRWRLPLGRPWLTLLLDVFTRCVLGLYVSFDAPSAVGVALAMAQAVLPKDEWLAFRGIGLAWPMHGLPAVLHLDNAREFRSRALRLGCEQHGVSIEHRPPATPRFGGHIERLMGTLMGRIHALPGTTFSNVAERGDYPSEQRAVLTLAEFEKVLALEVLGPYHNEVHSALGRTPAAAWAEGAAVVTTPPRMPPDRAAFVLDFLPWEERVVRRDGLHLFNILYYHGALETLIGAEDGRVRVKYDPRDLGRVFAELPQGGGHLAVPYAELGRPPISLWEHRGAVRALRETGRRTVDERTIFEAVAERRRVVAEAGARTEAARRDAARAASRSLNPTPASAATAAATRSPAPREGASTAAAAGGDDGEARVPPVVEGEAWMTEFLPMEAPP